MPHIERTVRRLGLTNSIRHQLATAKSLDHVWTTRVIRINHSHPWRRSPHPLKQPHLRSKIPPHRPVIIQSVLCQLRNHRHIHRPPPPHPPLQVRAATSHPPHRHRSPAPPRPPPPQPP